MARRITSAADSTVPLGPAPARLPLAGGPPGTTVSLRPLLCGEMLVPPGFFYRRAGSGAGRPVLGLMAPQSQWLRCPIGAFLLEHPLAGPVLVDTGLHTSTHAGLRSNFGGLNAAFFRTLRTKLEQSTVAQLRGFGIEPADVAVIVMTHLHVDHASALSELPEAVVICRDAEWRTATARLGEWKGYYRDQLCQSGRVRTVDFRRGPDHAPPFANTIDLFGDGSVVLISTPGHSPGHVSVLVRLEHRDVLLLGDAVYTMQNLNEDILPWRTADDDAYRRSMSEIRTFIERHPRTLVIPTHDVDVWERLDQLA